MWNVVFFHTLHLRRWRSLGEHTLQVRQAGIRAFRDHFHRPITQVAGEPMQAQTGRLSPYPPAEPHPLDPTVDEEAHGGHVALYPWRLCAARLRYHQM